MTGNPVSSLLPPANSGRWFYTATAFEVNTCLSPSSSPSLVFPLAMFPPSILSSPALSSASRLSDGSSRHSDQGHPFPRTKSQSEFEIERPHKSATSVPKRPSARRLQSDYAAEHALRASVSRFLTAKARPFTASGRIPLDPSALVLFFRSKVSHLPTKVV